MGAEAPRALTSALGSCHVYARSACREDQARHTACALSHIRNERGRADGKRKGGPVTYAIVYDGDENDFARLCAALEVV